MACDFFCFLVHSIIKINHFILNQPLNNIIGPKRIEVSNCNVFMTVFIYAIYACMYVCKYVRTYMFYVRVHVCIG